MKNVYFTTVIVASAILLFFTACSSKKHSSISLPELIHAEAIMYEYPDSALHILQNMKMPDAAQKLEHATWALLMTQAKYKMYIEQNDSLANIAYDYFMKQEDAQRKALVLYLRGGIYHNNKDIEKAQEFFLKATEYEKMANDYQLCHLINAELGSIYVLHSYNEYALNAFNKAYQYALQASTPKYIIASQIYLGRTYTELKQYNSAIDFYQKAIENAQKQHNFPKVAAASNELSGVYMQIKDYKKAIYYAKQAINNSKGAIKEQVHLAIGNIYSNIGQTDSAYYHLIKATSPNKSNILTATSAYNSLYKLSKKEHKYKEAISFCDSLLNGLDSVYNSHKNQELAEMQEKYNQQKLINEKNQLKIEKDRNTRNTLIVIILLICTITFLIYTYQRKLMKKERIIQKKEEEIRHSIIQINENKILIRQNQSKMQELAIQIETNKGMQAQLEELNKTYSNVQKQNEMLIIENKKLQKNIEQYIFSLNTQSEELKKLNKLTEESQRLHDRERTLSKKLVKNTKILHNLITTPKYVDTTQWKDIEESVNDIFDHFTDRLQKKLPLLTEYEVHLCCLIKLSMNNTNIATALGISPASVSKQKYRLKEHILQQTNKFSENQTLDLWIWDF